MAGFWSRFRKKEEPLSREISDIEKRVTEASDKLVKRAFELEIEVKRTRKKFEVELDFEGKKE